MGKIIKLIVVAGIIYFGLTYAIPWFKGLAGAPLRTGGASTGSGAGRCIDLASRASSAFGEEIRRFSRPPFDVNAWSASVTRLQIKMADADSACYCPSAACPKAREALSELRTLVSQFEGFVRGDATGMSNPASLQERVDQLLDEARALSAY